MAAQKQRRLGRGLSSLIQPQPPVMVEVGSGAHPQSKHNTSVITSISPQGEGTGRMAPAGLIEDGSLIRAVGIDDVRPSRFQPRRHFDEASLDQLAASITRAGLMQPIIVRPSGGGGYELVAGERRWRAAQRAGLREVLAVVRELGDEDAAEWALIENIQREELNPIERAHGLRGLAERFGLSHAELGERVGLDRSTVANLIRLTELEEEVQVLLAEGRLLMGHARAILGMAPGAARVAIAGRAASGSWSVRRVEGVVRDAAQTKREQSEQHESNVPPTQRELVIADIERRLADHLGTKVSIMLRASGNRGRVQLEFYSLEQFEGLMERIGLADEAEL